MRLTEKVHQILTSHLKAGDLAIDATAGNGHDTVFLAAKVGPSGKVIAIDIQAAAIAATRQRLIDANLIEHVELHTGDHAQIIQQLTTNQQSTYTTITFNLGYLPGSNHGIQTLPETTLAALNASLILLRPCGLLCVTAYRGHPGGQDEANSVEQWMRQQETDGHQVESHIPESQNRPPILWVLKKL